MEDPSGADLARQIVTAFLILEEEKPKRLMTEKDAREWTDASGPYGELIDEFLERMDEGEEWLATNVIGQLVNLLAATIEYHLAWRNDVARRQGLEPMTALEWWRETSQNLEMGGE